MNKILAFLLLLMLPALGAPIELTTATQDQKAGIRAALQTTETRPMVIPFPSGFTTGGLAWTPPFTIIRERSGRFVATRKAESYKAAGGISIHVDVNVVGGSGDGSSRANAYSSLASALTGTAYTTIPTPSTPATIYIYAGRYGVLKSMASNPLLRHTNFIGVDGKAELSAAVYGDEVTWTDESATYANTWSTPYVAATGYNVQIFDSGNLDFYGNPTFVQKASNLSLVASPNRSYISGNKLWVHLFDNTKPSSRLAFSASDVTPNSVDSGSNGNNLYCENIRFAYGFHAWRSFNTATINCVFKNCDFFGGFNKCAENQSSGITWFEGCTFRRAGEDGISYRDSAKGVEIDCDASTNGYYGNTPGGVNGNNGSTLHGNSNVVRLNGTYLYNNNRNIHDIEGGKSFNCGVMAGYSLGTTGNPYDSSDFVASYDGFTGNTRMWLLECFSEGSVGNYNAYDSGILYRRDSAPGITTGDGTFSSF